MSVTTGMPSNLGERLKDILLKEPFVLIDVGARGAPHALRNLRSYTRLIGFEPDAEESARINALPAETHGLREMRILPIALARESGTVT